MKPVDIYDESKIKYVSIRFKTTGIINIIECYDDGKGITKEEDGFLWVKIVRVLSAPGNSTPLSRVEWIPKQPLSKIEYNISNQENNG